MVTPLPLDRPGFAATLGPLTLLPGAGPRGADLIRMAIEPSHEDGAGHVHGGVLMTFAQVILGALVAAETGQTAPGQLSITCDFLGSTAVNGFLQGHGRITRKTRSIMFLAVEVHADPSGPDHPVLNATGLWRLTAG